MNVADTLAGEHGVFHLLVEQLDDALARCRTIEELHTAAAPLAISLLGHARIEEETLFVPLEQRLGGGGPTHCLRHEHQTMDRMIRALFRLRDPDTMRAAVRDVLAITRRHLAREEQVLFEAARTALGDAELEALGAAWAQARGITPPEAPGVTRRDSPD
ncbi:MAG TPA: hemerythrin domain-containing protein [Candidatus Limnocylindria bacterium]|nr:hemerythrin domain-containing protein [Candidatus Limnocylindria bacterium]